MINWTEIDFLDSITKVSTNGKKVRQKDYLIEGKFPVIDQGQDFIGGYTNDATKAIINQGSVIVFGDHTLVVKLVPFDFVPGADGIKVIKPSIIYHPKLFYLFISILAQKIPHKGYARHFQHLEKTRMPLPPYNEQVHIVETIEELFSDLDNAIENLKKAQEQLKVYRQAILWKGFEGGFTGGAKGWKTCRITDVCTLIDGDRGKNYPKKHELLDAGYCLFLSAKNVRPNGFEFKDNIFISKEKHEKLRSGTLQRGDVVITTRGTIGNVALYDESVPFLVVRLNSGMLILRSKTDELLNKYLATFLRSPLFVWQIRKRKSGTAQPQLPANVLGEFEIKIPPVDAQSRIIEETDSRLSICDQAELTIEENLMKAQSVRQSILKHAFEGKLTEQWRKDHKDLISGENSAEALLKKIKAEKETLKIKSRGRNKND
jgi:type I restriction enzyme S subunit